MTARNIKNILTSGNSYRNTMPCHAMWNMTLKLPQYFYLLTENPLIAISKFGLFTVRRHSATWKHLSLSAKGDRSSLGKPKIDKHQHYSQHTTNIHLSKSFSADLIIQIHFLSIPIGKDGVQDWSMQQNIYLTMYFCCDTITRRVTSQG